MEIKDAHEYLQEVALIPKDENRNVEDESIHPE